MTRRHAYVLAADPHFLTASIRSYYDLVDRIVVSYDESGSSWTGTPIPVDECLAQIRTLDTENKCVLLPGHHADTSRDPLRNDTAQRRQALEAASDGADWVLQLDTDEVVVDPVTFSAAIDRADAAGAEALHYPSRWLYTHAGGDQFLEASTRFGRPASSYPGPLAVRSGTRLRLCRQTDAPHYRVDVRPWNTDTFHPRDMIVHEVIPLDSAVVHYSWVRPPEVMRRKFAWSGHANEYSKPEVYALWEQRSRHPYLTALTTPLRRTDWFRLGRVHNPSEAGT